MLKPSSTALFLICRCGAQHCALPLANVIETMRPLPVETLNGMPAFLLGVAVIRDTAVPVIDLAGLVGTAAGELRRYITLDLGARTVAVAVEAVIGMRSLPQDALATLPPLLRETNSEVISAITILDADMLLILRNSHLLPESVWAAIESTVPAQ